MAEQEVIKHTRKIYRIWNSRQHSLWYKIKEFVLEILIIVFAVTLSIWLHDRSEHKHQQKEVKEFLVGLKADLQSDLKEMDEDRKTFLKSSAAFNFIKRLKPGDSLNMDSVKKHNRWLFNTTSLNPNNGRFEGFKSSGKIGTIEDHELQNDIMDLYQENIPSLLSSTAGYNLRKQKFMELFTANIQYVNDTPSNAAALLVSNSFQNSARMLIPVFEITERYEACMSKIKKIIAAINKEYGFKS